jgi:hypothetical protein
VALTALARRVVDYLQDQYLKIGRNDPVESRPLASLLGLTDREIQAVLHETIDLGDQHWLEQVGKDAIRLGISGRLEADRRNTT